MRLTERAFLCYIHDIFWILPAMCYPWNIGRKSPSCYTHTRSIFPMRSQRSSYSQRPLPSPGSKDSLVTSVSNWLAFKKFKGLMRIREGENSLLRVRFDLRFKTYMQMKTANLIAPHNPFLCLPSLAFFSLHNLTDLRAIRELRIREWPMVVYGFSVVWRLNPYENNISLLHCPPPAPLEAAAFHI